MAEQETSNSRSPFPYIRLTLTVVLLACILLLYGSGKIDLVAFLTLVLSLLGINFLESLFTSIDVWDSWVEQRLKNFFLLLSKFSLGRNLIAIGGRIHFLTYLVLILIILVLIFHKPLGDFIGPIDDSACLNVSLPWCSSGIGVSTVSNDVRIGLITKDGDGGPFDQSGKNGEEKNVESLIFQENRTSCTGSHMTLVVATMLSRTIEDPTGSVAIGLANVEGAYIAQKSYNDGKPPIRLCLAIANIGTATTANSALPQVIQQIRQFSRYDASFRGVVGMPYSAQAQTILTDPSWQQAGIPIVSPSATSDSLSNKPNFYRVDSPDQIQGIAQATFFCANRTSLTTVQGPVTVDVFYDPNNAYSLSLSADFESNVQKCGISIDREKYTIGDDSSIQRAIDNAMNKGYKFIFFAGYNTDQDALENGIQENTLSNRGEVPSGMTVLSGDGLADFTNLDHSAFTPIYMTAYTYPLKNDAPEAEKFIGTYRDAKFPLPVFADSIPSYTLFPPDSIRGYNAVKAFTSTLSNTGVLPTQQDLNNSLAGVQFESFGTTFLFQGDKPATAAISDPAPIPVAIMCTTSKHTIHLVATYGTDSNITLYPNGGGFCS